jgi:hypothetical protein
LILCVYIPIFWLPANVPFQARKMTRKCGKFGTEMKKKKEEEEEEEEEVQ